MREESAPADVAIARIAERQHGVVTVAQLHSFGIEKSNVSRRVRNGRLHRVHRGIYAVGHRLLSREGWWMAAVLACGEGAVLSHAAAAALWGLLRPMSGPVDVSVPTHGGRGRRRGIRIHRCQTLGGAGATSSHHAGGSRPVPPVTVRHRIPVTTIARTLDDLRGAVPPRLLKRARRQAELAGWRLEGVKPRRTRSELEEEFLRLCRRHRL
ncbi:MAG TPA: type IV toxin-antitoxin system AbiEi family antitoxin domain-containing protein, partial [Solirubrobacterales bacterium]